MPSPKTLFSFLGAGARFAHGVNIESSKARLAALAALLGFAGVCGWDAIYCCTRGLQEAWQAKCTENGCDINIEDAKDGGG